MKAMLKRAAVLADLPPGLLEYKDREVERQNSMTPPAAVDSTPRGVSTQPIAAQPLKPDELRKIDAYWRAANYLSVGQIYLYANPLLREPLKIEHVKPRLLGHFGTTPGLNFIYAHFNRLIKNYDLNVIYLAGPGHGGPGMVANTYLEGSYSEFYPNITQNEEGMQRLFKQFSFPEEFRATPRPKLPAPFTRAENWVIRSCTLAGRCSTTPICSPVASWETARRKRGRSPRAGTATSF
jgi:hypothetical protein